MKITTKQLVQTALLLALCIVSQFLKNTSVYITGPIVNAILIIALLVVGLWSAVVISVIAPITSYFITGAPIIMVTRFTMWPVIMIGNILLVLGIYYGEKLISGKKGSYIGMAVGSVIKAAFMWIMTSFVLFPIFGGALPEQAIAAAKVTFSVTQLITAIIGCVLAVVIMVPLKKYLKSE